KPGNQVGELEPLEDFLASIRTLDNVSLIKANRRLSDYLTQNPLDVNAHARAVILVEAMMGYEDLIHLFERHFYWNRVTFHQAIQEYLLSKNFTPAEISWEVKLSDVHSKYIRTDYIQSTKAFETLFVEYPEFIKPEYDFLEYLNVSSDKENKGRDAEGNLSSNIRIALAEARVQREGEFSGQFFDKLLKNKYDMPHVSPELSFRFMIALQPTVSLGHFVNNRAIKMETEEFTESLNAYYGTTHSNGDAKELAVFWNAAPKEVIGLDEEKKLSLKVIDWGMWAHLHQRQLINAMEKEYKFWSQSFSDPDRASALLSDLEDSFSDLYLFSYFHFLNVQPMNEKYRTNFATGLRDTPELFPPAAWLTENWTVSQAPDKNYQDDPKRKGFSENPERIRYFWFSSPPGSLFKVLIYRHPKDDMNDLWNRRLAGFYPPQKKKAPVIIYMDSIYLNNGALPTAEQKQEYLKEVLANIKDNNKYPTMVYQVIDQYKNQEEFTWLTSELWKILLEKDSSMLYQYLWNNWALIPEDDFAKYGEQMFRETSDRVAVSHLMLPLVILHYHRGEMSLVKRYANEGERVYSYDGLMAASVAYVMQKNYKQALETYEAIQNRYEQEGRYFDSFLLKAPEQFIESKGYGDRRRKVIAEAFPQGMDKITEIPQAPPTKGVRILSLAEDAPADLPLKPEDIIIAIGGYPYYEANQYQHLRYLNFFHNFRVMLWRPSEQKYHEFLISYPQRRLFCNVETWPLAPQPADAAPPATP
ncbi:MAG: hypothetical protein SFY68_05840, partial [Candidatus Sumerlaeia bacterium]|nr:hypothetical protein [Candidatus Sumerlaeia bacterium]